MDKGWGRADLLVTGATHHCFVFSVLKCFDGFGDCKWQISRNRLQTVVNLVPFKLTHKLHHQPTKTKKCLLVLLAQALDGRV